MRQICGLTACINTEKLVREMQQMQMLQIRSIFVFVLDFRHLSCFFLYSYLSLVHQCKSESLTPVGKVKGLHLFIAERKQSKSKWGCLLCARASICVCVCVCVREREKVRERDRERLVVALRIFVSQTNLLFLSSSLLCFLLLHFLFAIQDCQIRLVLG